MNHDSTWRTSGEEDEHQGEAHLRWQLRGLRRELPPARDLWPQIAARIAATTPSRHAPVRRASVQHAPVPHAPIQPQYHTLTRPWASLALAASLLLTIGLAWQLRQLPAPAAATGATTSSPAALASRLPASGSPLSGTPVSSPRATSQPTASLIHREADAMAREYNAALRELRAATPVSATPVAEAATLRTLDRSAAQIRTAMTRDPDARFLLERLRHTYAQRLALTQRATLA